MASRKENIASELDIWVKSFKETIRDFLPKCSLEEMIKVNYSDALDRMILAEESFHDTMYVGGEFSVILIDENHFKLAMALYFRDKDKKWIKKSATTEAWPTKYLCKKDFIELCQQKKISFEIEAPEKIVSNQSQLLEKRDLSTSEVQMEPSVSIESEQTEVEVEEISTKVVPSLDITTMENKPVKDQPGKKE